MVFLCCEYCFLTALRGPGGLGSGNPLARGLPCVDQCPLKAQVFLSAYDDLKMIELEGLECVEIQGKALQGNINQGPQRGLYQGTQWLGWGRCVGVTLSNHHKNVLGHL